jgi:flagellar biosynthetic protein FlhB
MAEDSESFQDKTEEPSTRRIEDFRRKGEVASSRELTNVLVLSASIATLMLSLTFIYEEFSEFISWLYGLDFAMAYTDKSLATITRKTISTALTCAAPVCLVALSTGIIANVAQVGFLFAPEVLEFKPERIDPINGMKKLFSIKSLVEALKAVLKFVFILAIVYFSVKDDLHVYKGYFHVELIEGFMHSRWMIFKLSMAIITGLALIAAGDFAYQKLSYRKKLMMTKEEAKKESKEQDGNPEIKQRIRTLQREAAQKRMMQDVPTADVIVTNPTHLSIAIKYDKETMISPEVIAKGADHVALKIREIAKEHDIPIVENVPLARSMYKTVELGGAVPRNLYKAVAEVLAFVYRLKRKKKALG